MTSARDLSAHLADLLRCERAALSEFLVALADFHRRRLWLELGHASLFYFLHRELGLSSGAAFYRKTAAELIEKFPEIIEPLRDGRLCLTSVVELAKVLTPENREDVLPRFFHLSKSGAKAVSAALRPDEAAPHRDVITAVRAPVAAATLPLSGRAAVEPAPEPPFHLDEVPRANSRSRTVAASLSAAHGHRAAHRRAEPASRDRVPRVPREARGRSRRALPLASGRERAGRSSKPGSTSSSSATTSEGVSWRSRAASRALRSRTTCPRT